jgi:hypothetical protein
MVKLSYVDIPLSPIPDTEELSSNGRDRHQSSRIRVQLSLQCVRWRPPLREPPQLQHQALSPQGGAFTGPLTGEGAVLVCEAPSSATLPVEQPRCLSAAKFAVLARIRSKPLCDSVV